MAEGVKSVLPFSDGFSFLPALLQKFCYFAIKMKGERLGEGRKEKDKIQKCLRTLCVVPDGVPEL